MNTEGSWGDQRHFVHTFIQQPVNIVMEKSKTLSGLIVHSSRVTTTTYFSLNEIYRLLYIRSHYFATTLFQELTEKKNNEWLRSLKAKTEP